LPYAEVVREGLFELRIGGKDIARTFLLL